MCERGASPYHLLLDTCALSTTNVKMKKIHFIAGLFVIGFLAQSGLAQSKPYKGRTQRQVYLPPSAPSGPIITEEYITIHKEAPNGKSSFKESNYGGGKYQIFEIHSNYEPSATPREVQGNYLPPQQEIRVEHVQQAPSSNDHHVVGAKGITPLAPVSNYQNGHSNGPTLGVNSGRSNNYATPVQEEIIRVRHIHVQNSEQQTHYKAADYLPPLSENSENAAVSYPQTSIALPAPEPGVQAYLSPHQEQHNTNQLHTHSLHHEAGQYKGGDYLPPHDHHFQSSPIAIQGVSQQQQLNSFANHQQESSFNGAEYLPPHAEHYSNHQEVQFPTQQTGQFKGAEYLPPYQGHHHEGAHQHVGQQQTISQPVSQLNSLKGAEYLPPHRNTHAQQQQTTYQAPEYLPPYQQQSHKQEVQQHAPQQQTAFKSSDYLPPHHEQHVHQQEAHQQVQYQPTSYKGPDYLPPHQTQQNHYEELQQHPSQQPISYKGPDYLPPRHDQQNEQQVAFKGPDYLPPQEEQHSHQHEVHQQIQRQPTTYKGPEYLPPPHQEDDQHYHFQQQHTQQALNNFRGPDYLPPHQRHQTSNHVTQSQTNTGSSLQLGALPAGYEPQVPAVPVAPLPQPATQNQHEPAAYAVPSGLPDGYDFAKPANAEQAIAELHTLPEEKQLQQEVVVQSQIQVAQGPQQADIIYGTPNSGANYQANGYLPPHQSINNYSGQQTNVQTVPSSAQQYQLGLQQVAPQTFTPTPATPLAQAPASNYLPPAIPVQAHHHTSSLRSLNSYMTSVQPFQRYASIPRQPFRAYGPPPAAPNQGAIAQQQQYQQPQPLAVAPMYREQTSQPSYYAPAMSYATNAVANNYAEHHTAAQHQHSSFNKQTQQSFQQFKPGSASVYQPAAAYSSPVVPVSQSISSKIRTVQIVNPAAVKTLKILETSDHAGVKTIKILGPSNEQPTGEHQVIKVVSQNTPNAHEHVQTVKIFNDHQELSNHGSAGGNAYLPPSERVARQTPLRPQLLSNEKHRRPLNGRQRYRY